jgi:pimeloyl-ACP methyl ester carboxylesterase
MFMTSKAAAQPSDKTLILIAGAGHGAWCWEKVTPLLKDKGYKVIALDVSGSGNDTAKLENNTLDDDVAIVMNAANAVNGKVILLGHSSGGIIISQAAELLGTNKVDKLIYLDAFLPQNGESVFSLAEKLVKRNQPSRVSNTSTSERFIFSIDNKKFICNRGVVELILFHDCSQEEISL